MIKKIDEKWYFWSENKEKKMISNQEYLLNPNIIIIFFNFPSMLD